MSSQISSGKTWQRDIRSPHIQRRSNMETTRERCGPVLRHTYSHRKLKEARNWFPPMVSGGRVALLMPCF